MTTNRRKKASEPKIAPKTPDVPVVPADAATEPPAMLIHCKVARLFCDGNTTERFKALGYDVDWPAEQVRDITLDLFEACKISGARIEIVPDAE